MIDVYCIQINIEVIIEDMQCKKDKCKMWISPINSELMSGINMQIKPRSLR